MKTKLCQEVIELFEKKHKLGVPVAVIARACGLSVNTVQQWLGQGRGVHPRLQPTKLTRAFAEAIDRAKQEQIERLLALGQLVAQGGQEYTEERIEYEPGGMTNDGVQTQKVKARTLIRKKTERDPGMIRWLLEKLDREHFGRQAEVNVTGALGTYVVEAPAPEDDLEAWRKKYTPQQAQQMPAPTAKQPTGVSNAKPPAQTNGNGHANGHATNGHAKNGNGHGGSVLDC